MRKMLDRFEWVTIIKLPSRQITVVTFPLENDICGGVDEVSVSECVGA